MSPNGIHFPAHIDNTQSGNHLRLALSLFHIVWGNVINFRFPFKSHTVLDLGHLSNMTTEISANMWYSAELKEGCTFGWDEISANTPLLAGSYRYFIFRKREDSHCWVFLIFISNHHDNWYLMTIMSLFMGMCFVHVAFLSYVTVWATQ